MNKVKLWSGFPEYTEYDPKVPVRCVTPDLDGCIHRFFDSNPISPSGKYLALTRLLHEDRPPVPGDIAEIILIDLETGKTEIIAETCAFGTQTGAQVQWGVTDNDLFYNDLNLDMWRAFAVKIDPFIRAKTEYQQPLYMVSPDGRYLAGPCLLRTDLVQAGYGAVVPVSHLPLNREYDPDDGLYVTDIEKGESELFLSFYTLNEILSERFIEEGHKDGAAYGFHVKWNAQGNRIMFIFRYRPRSGGRHTSAMATHVVSVDVKTKEVFLSLPNSIRQKGGHHPAWAPDGEYITQNLNIDGDGLRFVKYRYDGTDLQNIAGDIPGSGHPNLHPDGRFIITDSYTHEPVAFGDGTVPIRWADIKEKSETVLARLRTQPLTRGPSGELRIDPHPAFDGSYTRVTFNGAPDGKRKVFIADLDGLFS